MHLRRTDPFIISRWHVYLMTCICKRYCSVMMSHLTLHYFFNMFRRFLRKLFPGELDCCFRCLFKRKSFAEDEELEELGYEELTRGQSQPSALPMAMLEEARNPKKAYVWARDSPLSQDLENVYDKYVAVVESLAAEESVASTTAACTIIYAFYGRLSPHARGEMWKLLRRLSMDDDVRVRKVVITVLANLAKETDSHSLTSYIIPILEKLSEGTKVAPCLEAAQLAIYIATWPHVSEDARLAVIPVLFKFATHPSWEIRYMIANNFNQVQKALRAHFLKSGLTAVLPSLMKDPEPRVRMAADIQFEAFCKNLSGM